MLKGLVKFIFLHKEYLLANKIKRRNLKIIMEDNPFQDYPTKEIRYTIQILEEKILVRLQSEVIFTNMKQKSPKPFFSINNIQNLYKNANIRIL